MRIIICGAGQVGQGIAERLSSDNDVTIVDSDASLVERVSSLLEVRGVVGHASHPDILKNAGAENAEMIIAVTYSDEVNMITCQMAHSLFQVPNKIARIRSQVYLNPAIAHVFTPENAPIDMHISPEIEVGESIIQRYRTPGAFVTADFAGGRIKLLGVEVDDKSSIQEAAIGDLRRLLPEDEARIVGIGRHKRNHKVFTPTDDFIIRPGDRVYWLTRQASVRRMFDVLGGADEKAGSVIIVGAGNIGLYVAQQLEAEGLAVRLIEKDRARAEIAAEQLRRSIIINGEGLNPDLLEEAGVGKRSTVIGLTSDDKTNMLLGAVAKQLGAKKVVALVNKQELSNIKSSVGIDIVVDPRSVTVSKILLRLRQGRLSNLHSVEGGIAEVVEGRIRETSQLVGMTLSKDPLPEGVTAGALVRDGEALPLSERIRVDDVVILFSERVMARKVDQMYRVKPEFY